MVFPAGAPEPLTFKPKADDGANFGSLAGSWAGHELTHGFDDEGRHFDAKGNLTDCENVADYGGILTGYDALEKALQAHGRPGLIDGFTPEQRFFIGYAQSW